MVGRTGLNGFSPPPLLETQGHALLILEEVDLSTGQLFGISAEAIVIMKNTAVW